jgi:hypothetical protein
VTVDDLDQAIQETPFQWSSPYFATATMSAATPGATTIVASHDGYRKIGIIHWRCIVVRPDVGFVVHDVVVGESSHALAAHWHVGVDVDAVAGGARFVARTAERRIAIETLGGTPSLVKGALSPILGWHSPAYGVRRAISTLRLEHRGKLPHAFTTRVRIDGEFGPLAGESAELEKLIGQVGRG